MAKKFNHKYNKQDSNACRKRNPQPWDKYPVFPTVPSNVTQRYPKLANANEEASKEYLEMWKQDQKEWDMTDAEVIDHSYTSYRIRMSDKRGYLTAVASNLQDVPGKVNWSKECDNWDLYETRAEAERHLAEDFFAMLGCYSKIRGRVVSCGDNLYEVQLIGYYALKPKKEE